MNRLTDDRRSGCRPVIGVSSCLLGNEVRYDGSHKRNRFVVEEMAGYFDLEPYCPEVAIGMGVPRQPIRLVTRGDTVEAVGVTDPGLNVTGLLRDYSERIAGQVVYLSGFVFKKGSPSCGMERVKVFDANLVPKANGAGLFASAIMSSVPLLPVEEEGRLNDSALRDNFMTRVHVYQRWRLLRQTELSRASLIGFHSNHKYLVMSRSTEIYRDLGRMLANLSVGSLSDIADRYFTILMTALRLPATRARHANVLQHLLGYLKKDLSSDHRRDIARVIDDYRRGRYPLIVPLSMLQHHFNVHRNDYLADQVYLYPYDGSLSKDA